MNSLNLKKVSFRLIFSSFLGFYIFSGGTAIILTACDQKSSTAPSTVTSKPTAPAGIKQPVRPWNYGLTPEQQYDFGIKRLNDLKAYREKLIQQNAPVETIKVIDGKIIAWQKWIAAYIKKNQK